MSSRGQVPGEPGDPGLTPPQHDGDAAWIDRVLDRTSAPTERPPVVPEPALDPTGQLPAVGAQRPITDELAQIDWAPGRDVSPASEPIAQQPTFGSDEQALTPESVGRSAWDDDLRSIGREEPEGWENLSWHDMEGDGSSASELPEPSTFVSVVREWGPVLIAAVVIALFTRLILVQAYHIPSLSMAPTLDEGDRVIVNRLSYNFGEIERGQVVVFKKPPNQPSAANDLIKRVIGLPGETIQFRDSQVYVDGLLVQEPYLSQQNSTRTRSLSIPGCAQETPSPELCTIPEGYVFVMGDNRVNSQDSRVFGPVAIDTIVGRAFVRVWPLDNLSQL